MVVLRTLQAPSLDEFEELIAAARSEVRKAGLGRKDLEDAVSRVRRPSTRGTD